MIKTMEKKIEEFRGKAYEQVFLSPDADMGKVCGELCCFSVMMSDGPRYMSPVDGRFDGCAIGNFVWKEVLNKNDEGPYSFKSNEPLSTGGGTRGLERMR